MIQVDGSFGEGGGQILRTALAISLIKNEPLHVYNIRKGRKDSGLKTQHLASVNACVKLCNAKVKGNYLNSEEIEFEPQKSLVGGEYEFLVESPGSGCLLLQAILPPLLIAEQESNIKIIGGTHNPMAPTYEFCERSLFPLLKEIGYEIQSQLHTYGFYPSGDGVFTVNIKPTFKKQSVNILTKSRQSKINIQILVKNIPDHLIKQQILFLKQNLKIKSESIDVEYVNSQSEIVFIILAEIKSSNFIEIFSSTSIKKEKVFEDTKIIVDEICDYLSHNAPIGKHLANQIILPILLGRGGSFRTGKMDLHTTTIIELLQQVLNIPIIVMTSKNKVNEIKMPKFFVH